MGRPPILEAGRTALALGRLGPSTREDQLAAQVEDLTQALDDAAVELPAWKKSAEGRPEPFEDLEVLRSDAVMPTARFCQLVGTPERSYRR